MALRFLNNLRKSGFKEFWKQLNTIGDSKSGVLVGTDKFGNRYFENLDEVYGDCPIDMSAVYLIP
jgi:NADH dehydrogenase [ubiquinone] 1 alpha subcomplex assembly factor 2